MSILLGCGITPCRETLGLERKMNRDEMLGECSRAAQATAQPVENSEMHFTQTERGDAFSPLPFCYLLSCINLAYHRAGVRGDHEVQTLTCVPSGIVMGTRARILKPPSTATSLFMAW